MVELRVEVGESEPIVLLLLLVTLLLPLLLLPLLDDALLSSC